MYTNKFNILLLAMATILPGCHTLLDPEESGTAQKERWNYRNAPERFTELPLERNINALPSSGRAERNIWPSTYWPVYKDSINQRWNDSELSPAEKYDMAFNGWEPSAEAMAYKPYTAGGECSDFDREYYSTRGLLATYVSENMGNEDARDSFDNDGDGEVDECGDRDGVETWWGLCHAWVPAAMLEKQPQNSVEANGVTFYPGDIEALIIAAYHRSAADMIGDRCNDKDVERDEQGRVSDLACRDTNPGTLHLIATNYLGLNSRSFAEDRTFNYEVWNQPVVSFEVVSMDEVSVEEALTELEVEPDEAGTFLNGYHFNEGAVSLYSVAMTLTYLTESEASETANDSRDFERNDHYTYILEVDADGEIIGGEWTGDSKEAHPDFLWLPKQREYSAIPYLDIDIVRDLIERSIEE